MISYYRTANALGILVGINLLAKFINLDIIGDVGKLLISNHIVEASAVFAVVSFLIDLGLLNSNIQGNYIKIWLITFFAGIFIVAASFSSLFVMSSFVEITKAWFKVAPQIITMAIGGLYITNRLIHKPTIFGMPNIGKRGLLNVFVFSIAYSMAVVYLMIKYGLLVI